MNFDRRRLRARRTLSLVDAVAKAGALSGLECVIDPKDIRCYPGSGQTLFDASGKGLNFFFGSGSGSDALDPVFSGPPGSRALVSKLTEPSLTGKLVTASASPAFTNFHQAGAKFTFLQFGNYDWFWAGNAFVPGQPGTQFGLDVSGSSVLLFYQAYRADASFNKFSTTISARNNPVPERYDIGAVAFDDAAGRIRFLVNDQVEERAASLATPSAAAAGTAFQVWGTGNNSNAVMGTGEDASGFALWSRALSGAELLRIEHFLNPLYGFTGRRS